MNQVKTVLLLGLLTALLMLAGQAVGGKQGMLMGLVFAALMNLGAYWFSDRIVLAMYRARPADEANYPELVRLVRDLTVNSGLPMPKVYVIPTMTPNAFATGRDPQHAAVAATEGIMRLLTREELAAVMAHELAHVKHRDTLISAIAATIAGAIGYLAHIARWGMIFSGGSRDRDNGGANAIAMLLTIIIMPIAAMLVQMAISRSREFLADEGGARISGNPRALASALAKLERGVEAVPMEAEPATAHMFIVNPLRGGGLLSLFSTHPPTAQRIARLEEMARRGVGLAGTYR
jgi:heat shock protein HtpX